MIGFTTLPIFQNRHLVERYLTRTCRSRKKRIRKKWDKNPKNWGTRPSMEVVVTDKAIFMHPEAYKRLWEAEMDRLLER